MAKVTVISEERAEMHDIEDEMSTILQMFMYTAEEYCKK